VESSWGLLVDTEDTKIRAREVERAGEPVVQVIRRDVEIAAVVPRERIRPREVGARGDRAHGVVIDHLHGARGEVRDVGSAPGAPSAFASRLGNGTSTGVPPCTTTRDSVAGTRASSQRGVDT